MSYKVVQSILGFEDTTELDIIKIDDLFSTMQDVNNKNISFTIVNPYELREYSFDVPSSLKILLDIKENSNVEVYNIVVIQKPIENSVINFLAPIIVNKDNNKIAQAVLNNKNHPDLGISETIKSFIS